MYMLFDVNKKLKTMNWSNWCQFCGCPEGTTTELSDNVVDVCQKFLDVSYIEKIYNNRETLFENSCLLSNLF